MNARTLILAALAGLALVAGIVFIRGPEDGRTADAVAETRTADAALGGTPAAELGAPAPGAPAGPSNNDPSDRTHAASTAGGAGQVGGTDASGPDADGSSEAPAGSTGAGGSTEAGGSTAARTSSSPESSSVASEGAPDGADGAAGQSAQDPVEEILRETSARYEDVRSLQADFEQQLTNTLLGRTTHSAGTLYQRQPDRFLMRFSDPAGDVIVSDGDYFWIYYPSVDPKQVIRTARGAGGLDLRSQFVGDPVRRFEAVSHGRETVRGRETHVLTLTPREPAGYRSLKVWIDAEDHLVRRFELREENGNIRRFDLTDLRINPTLDDALFEFEPPSGAVVVTR